MSELRLGGVAERWSVRRPARDRGIGVLIAAVLIVGGWAAIDGQPDVELLDWDELEASGPEATVLRGIAAACGYDLRGIEVDETAQAVTVSIEIVDQPCGDDESLDLFAFEAHLEAPIGDRDVLDRRSGQPVCRYVVEDGSLLWKPYADCSDGP